MISDDIAEDLSLTLDGLERRLAHDQSKEEESERKIEGGKKGEGRGRR